MTSLDLQANVNTATLCDRDVDGVTEVSSATQTGSSATHTTMRKTCVPTWEYLVQVYSTL